MTRAALLIAVIFVACLSAGSGLARTQEDPSQRANALLTQWTKYVARGAKLNPTPRFASARRVAIERIVQRNATRFHYTVQRVAIEKGRDGAPLVVVRVKHGPLVSFSKPFPQLWRALDPLIRSGPDWHAYKYEAFFFEAVDGRGVPFMVVWNAWRQPPRGGGQWARTEALLPFPHG